MVFKNYYKLLELENNIKSTQTEIKTAYREQAKKYHPDVNIQNKAAEERFKDISEGYRILSDPIQKKKYDKSWNSYVGKKLIKEQSINKEVQTNDIVNMFFGNNIQKKSKNIPLPIKGLNIETKISISIKEAFDGTVKNIGIKSLDEKEKNIKVKIPAGIKSGDKVRVKGKGKPGQNGGSPGDLIIEINIENTNIHKLVNNDIYVNVYLTPWDAALGTKVLVDGIDEQVSIIIPKGTQSGDKLSIQNKGYYKKVIQENETKERGNLIVKTKVSIPKKLSSEEKKLFMELREISKFDPKNKIIIN